MTASRHCRGRCELHLSPLSSRLAVMKVHLRLYFNAHIAASVSLLIRDAFFSACFPPGDFSLVEEDLSLVGLRLEVILFLMRRAVDRVLSLELMDDESDLVDLADLVEIMLVW